MDLHTAAIKIQRAYKRICITRKLTFYPLDMSDTASADYLLYLEYQGRIVPRQSFVKSYKGADVHLPTLAYN